MTMKKILFFLACALMLASCENYFIDQNLGGNDWIPTDVRTVSYTLTDADYTTIVKNEDNINIALGLLEKDSAAYDKLLLVDSLKYFENDSVAAYYLPAFIANKFAYLDEGSTVKVAFQINNPAPEYMALLDTIHTFNIADEAYTNVWGTNVDVPFLTPATEGKLLDMVKKSYTGTLADGVYAIQYDYSDAEPVFATADEAITLSHEDYVALTKYVADNKNVKYFESKKQGPVTTVNYDVDYYWGSNSKQNYINSDYATWRKKYDPEKLYSKLSNDELKALHAERLVEGFTQVILPAYFSNPRMGVYTISFLMGKDQSNLKREYITLMYASEYKLTFCSFTDEETVVTPGIDTISVGSRAALFNVSNGQIEFFNADGATALVLTPADYQLIGVDNLDRPERMLPKLLKNKFPFASFGTTYLVVYRKADGSLEAGRYTYNGTDWNVIKESKQKISSFTNVASNWEVAPAVYLLESFANSSQGDFTLQNVLLTGGLSYVWIPTASYGMKASAFVNQNNPSEAWLISPIVDLTEAEKPVLSFDQASKFGDLLNECFVMVSVDYEDDVTNCDWVHIPYNQDADGKYIIPDGSNWTFMATGDLDLSAFAGQRVTIGFKYTSTATSATTWEVKNLVVKENK
jgi:hypothetical protein